MSLSYFSPKKLRRQSKQHDTIETAKSPPAPAVSSPHEEAAASPVLDEEDEKFLERLAAIAQEPEGTPPPLPERPVTILDGGEKKVGKDAQEALLDLANTVPLPMSPSDVIIEDGGKGKGKEKATDDAASKRKNMMSYFALAQSKFKRTVDKDGKEKEPKEKKDKVTDKDRAKAANDLHSAAEAAKTSEEQEAEKEKQDLTAILDQLNLSAVNNRVFSFSKESEELLNKFKLVLKDIVNGAPTAYDDLSKLLTDSENQLKKMYGSLPPFLQNLIKSLPAKMTAALGPELMAAQAEKPGFDAKQRAGASGFSKIRGKRAKIPSLKSLISAEGAVATMLRSILSFLKLRFPALLTGTNVLLSLAVFLLLFVFWYCHKRGRETRLEKEGLDASAADSALASSASSFTDGDGDSLLDDKTKAGSSKAMDDKPQPPLIIRDDKEPPENSSATVEDMPSVLHLPDPKTVPLPEEGNTPLKEEPSKAPKDD